MRGVSWSSSQDLVCPGGFASSHGLGKIFCLPDEVCQHVVTALRCPELYADKVKDVGGSTESPIQYASCNIAVTFTDDDLLLGSKPHNRPLFMN